MGKKLSAPDYERWCRVDEWTFKEAALLLQGLDPLNYGNAKFNLRTAPEEPELKETYMTFLALKKFNGGKQRYMMGADPLDIFYMADEKKLNIPDKLRQCLHNRQKLEEEHQQPSPAEILHTEKTTAVQTDKNLSSRERRNLLKVIGLFVSILADEPKYAKEIFINGRINASQITQILLDAAYTSNINNQGIKSLERKLNEAIDILEEDKLPPTLPTHKFPTALR